jgi:hypothetical protein
MIEEIRSDHITIKMARGGDKPIMVSDKEEAVDTQKMLHAQSLEDADFHAQAPESADFDEPAVLKGSTWWLGFLNMLPDDALIYEDSEGKIVIVFQKESP